MHASASLHTNSPAKLKQDYSHVEWCICRTAGWSESEVYVQEKHPAQELGKGSHVILLHMDEPHQSG